MLVEGERQLLISLTRRRNAVAAAAVADVVAVSTVVAVATVAFVVVMGMSKTLVNLINFLLS